jgi:hypothetical protein
MQLLPAYLYSHSLLLHSATEHPTRHPNLHPSLISVQHHPVYPSPIPVSRHSSHRSAIPRTIPSTPLPYPPLPSSPVYYGSNEFTNLRSSLRSFNFLTASSSGTSAPCFCVAGSSRLRILRVRDFCSSAPTTMHITHRQKRVSQVGTNQRKCHRVC